jgi:hypothetical protein
MKILPIAFSLFTVPVIAQLLPDDQPKFLQTPKSLGKDPQKVQVHGTLSAHVHGSGTLDWAFENEQNAEIEFHADGASIFGFEHKPRTEGEKATYEAALAKLRVDLPAALPLDASLGCSWKVGKVDVKHETHGKATHSEVDVGLKLSCKQGLKKVKLQPALSALFPKLETLVVRVVGPSKSALFTIVKDKGEVDFSKAL